MRNLSFLSFLLLLLPFEVFATPLTSPLAYLNAMTEAHRKLNYEQFYLLQQGEEVFSLRYRHAHFEGKEYAQLLRLDNAREEIILRDNMVSYFGEFQPFSLQSTQILDDLPSVLYTDFNQLNEYHFIDVGRTRIADKLARVIRIVPRDEFRYQYQLWIDEENHLLLRSDMLDRHHNLLEQFKVIQSSVDDQIGYIVEPISTLILPALIQTKSNIPMRLTWQPSWLPKGFRAISSSQQHITDPLFNEYVESELYSDGLFSFTIYVVENKGLIFEEQFWRQGKSSIYSQTIGNKDVVVVGEIPLMSARHIVQTIQYLQNTTPNRPLAERTFNQKERASIQ